MIAVAVVVAVAALALGAVLGARFGAVRIRRRPPADLVATPRTQDRLSVAVVQALDHGVLVLNRDEQAILVNPAARAMGVLDVDRVAFPQLLQLARQCIDGAGRRAAAIDLPMGRLGREPIALAAIAVPLPDPDSLPGADIGPDTPPGATAPARVGAVALLLSDVSESRRLEAVRRDFVANVSHELKTPVGALTLLAEAITDAADDPETVSRFAIRMQQEGSRLGRLVRELIELSRVQGADPMPSDASVAVADVLAEVSDREHLAAEQAGITITTRCEPDLLVRGNGDQLITAVVNLVDNAIAYSGGGTKVVVTGARVRDDAGHSWVDIAVSDQGIGIADADADRIFERFYRVDPARSRATGGTGLGLAIVKNIVSNHLGSVLVWSREGDGSTFTIRLPDVYSDARPSAPVAAENLRRRNEPAAASLTKGVR